MKPPCENHADRSAIVHGLCQACYMRERRAKQRKEYQALYDDNVAKGVKGQTTKARDAYTNGASVCRLLPLWSHELDFKFRAKIDASGGPNACHMWIGTKNMGKYGLISLAGHSVLAHRLMHALVTGDATTEVVMHECDNPSCVNPKHLRSGTSMDNMADMREKGRGAKPEQLGQHLRKRDTHPRAKPVRTPFGEFPSATLAAEAVGIHPRRVSSYCQRAIHGWAYMD